ncbi:hypothetical protein T02_10499 [Trichinella nativa]|uniref:Uncharacterized protein n=1 Tax=Trichinella nativa TaxID=6335 RepID=A0A0V1KQX3_9BILA|nr:hypothetical protein T02_10499 [Trichinella nativa]
MFDICYHCELIQCLRLNRLNFTSTSSTSTESPTSSTSTSTSTSTSASAGAIIFGWLFFRQQSKEIVSGRMKYLILLPRTVITSSCVMSIHGNVDAGYGPIIPKQHFLAYLMVG